jgi:undecaprenyl-phosphate 4-deoxy-4-formamido-L-arabinose transferase
MQHPPGRTSVTIVGRVPADFASPVGEHLVSIVIPIYQAEHRLPAVIAEILPLTEHVVSPDGAPFRVAEVLLVNDCGPDDSARVLRELEREHPFVRAIWLSRNFGQHAATLAGMSSSGGDWIVTMDEDGQHDPAYIGGMLDTALAEQASVVYAKPTNPAPHSGIRNAGARIAKRLVTTMSGGPDASSFHSFRLVLGEVGRTVAAYAGAGVYLDVALGWVAGGVATAPVELCDEGATRRSGYSRRTLLSHFWRMVLTGGTRGLRMVSVLGLVFALLGLVIAVFVGYRQLVHPAPTPGWSSLVVVILISTGAILVSLGVIAEYVGVAVNMAMGKPLYLITRDPMDGPLGRPRPRS